MSEAINYLEMRLEKAKNFDEAAVIRKMIAQWNEKEQEYADRRARPLKIFLANCDQYYVIMDHVS